MDDKFIIKGSRVQLKKTMLEEYGKVPNKKPANENKSSEKSSNANDIAAIIRAAYKNNKKKYVGQ